MSVENSERTECPKCHSADNVRRILYGFPASDVDLSEFTLGGCVVNPGLDPEFHCVACEHLFGDSTW